MSTYYMQENRTKDLVRLKMVVLGKDEEGFRMYIAHKKQKTRIHYAPQTKQNSSNLIELMAVIRGLKMTSKNRRVQVVTDSQYVIKGISRWIYHWKLNRWKTANARKVKNKTHWKQLDRLINIRKITCAIIWLNRRPENPKKTIIH